MDVPNRMLIAAIVLGIVVTTSRSLWIKLLPADPPEQAIPRTRRTYGSVIFLVTIIGSLLWFLKAPDPRFGTGFLIPLVYFLYFRSPLPIILTPKSRTNVANGFKSVFPVYKIVYRTILIAVVCYSGHRFLGFFNSNELIRPSGIQKSAYEPLGCEDLKIDLLGNKINEPGAKNKSCKDDVYGGFTLRGQTIAEGFRPHDSSDSPDSAH
jgi:hypothetical protein